MLPTTLQIIKLRTFVPAKDFEVSRRFYQRIGFTERGTEDDMAFFVIGGFEFILQDYYVKDWANNFMMVLEVSNIDVWYEHLKSLELEKEFKNIKLSPPKDEGWATVSHLIDPSGVLWHVAQ